MANEEQVKILRQGYKVWNQWQDGIGSGKIELMGADLRKIDLRFARLRFANLSKADLTEVNFMGADLVGANLSESKLGGVDFDAANLSGGNLSDAFLYQASFCASNLSKANLSRSNLVEANLTGTNFINTDLRGANFSNAEASNTFFTGIDLGEVMGLEEVRHRDASVIGSDTLQLSKGKIPEKFLRGCGLPDWEIESAKLHNPDLGNEEINRLVYKIYDLRATQAIQISPLFISYSHSDSAFVDKLETYLNAKGVRFWRDIHDMKSGRLEKQIDRAMRVNPTVLLILSEHSLQSDWVEHEVRTARILEKERKRDVLCPVALDDSWKSSPWEKHIMEQVTKYNILDFSAWKDNSKFENVFNKLIDGLDLFYK